MPFPVSPMPFPMPLLVNIAIKILFQSKRLENCLTFELPKYNLVTFWLYNTIVFCKLQNVNIIFLSAFPNASNEKTDEQGRGPADVPLYSGAHITVAVSMLIIITFAVRHSLTGLALVDLLTIASLHCAWPNQCASSMNLVKKFFMKLKNPIQFHHYCSFCMEYQGLS